MNYSCDLLFALSLEYNIFVSLLHIKIDIQNMSLLHYVHPILDAQQFFYEVCYEFCRYWLRCVDINPRTEYEEYQILNWFFKCIFYVHLWKLFLFSAQQFFNWCTIKFYNSPPWSPTPFRWFVCGNITQLSFLLVFRIALTVFFRFTLFFFC